MGGRSRPGKIAFIAVGAAAGIVAVSAATGLFAMARVAQAVVTPARRRKQEQYIISYDRWNRVVTLAATPETRVPGRFGLWFGGDRGFARVGAILHESEDTVVRRVDEEVFGTPARGPARWSGWYYLRPEELGYPVSTVEIGSSLGQNPAWLVPAASAAAVPRRGSRSKRESRSPWVIQVHGRGAERQEALRAVPVFRESGYTSLIVSYRNDETAPRSIDRRYGLGGTEWLDVEAGIRFALDHGATSIVLMGWSMGGAIVLQTVTRSPSLEKVTGLVLESPVVDWIDTLEYQARALRIPRPIAQGARTMVEAAWATRITGLEAAIDLSTLDFVTRAVELSKPTLILHSDDDGYVPSTASRALTEARPDIVTLVPFSAARHTRLWNNDPDRWNESIRGWLAELG